VILYSIGEVTSPGEKGEGGGLFLEGGLQGEKKKKNERRTLHGPVAREDGLLLPHKGRGKA